MKHDVGGVLLERPFRIRRLGHFGVNCYNIEEAYNFYTRLLGFKLSDELPFAKILPPEKKHIAEGPGGTGYFLRYGSDHHSLVLFPKKVRDKMGGSAATPEGITTNQITWQVGSLQEVVDGHSWFKENKQEIIRAGRDMPGSNWHVYLFDTDWHVNELYYGIEQVGWSGQSKPGPMRERGFHVVPELPQQSEQQEVDEAIEAGIDISSGHRSIDAYDETFVVDGVYLQRPFRVTGIGPVRLFTADVDAMVGYYRDVMGMKVTEEIEYQGHRAVFLRVNTEHHSMAVYDIGLRSLLGLREDTSLVSFGMKVASYRQLRDAAEYLRGKDVEFVELPGELFPGMSYATHVKDPDGHVIQLYFGMEQVGWDGAPNEKRQVTVTSDPATWPESIEEDGSVFNGEVFMGPWS
ncbi:catechol 2,3-dioxygenase-like lactoylglutathione lyase family enzyme [Arthrobacter ginsengisoli]|uniref:Catechol 2,3-dioxygenase-like lactoylglutathione lyase family enzyme n=1 Tax=Arthrobacter ginsengisoli TaxID=1356565 RepID=A0ABU1UDR5_9MICC|nr:VOC family protein [Arthrobacter ginsengisoli]MDR7083270.1 catechol 2,3-dioxygenase-like lactoylglutathione lyase family enzyme [Arthrobacter ginsengisoli]